MSDIFISYAREDEAHAKRLAAALADAGWSVWWDRDIPTGMNFDQVIEEQMSTAGCIVVIWSERSVASQWVRAEALYAFERHTLVPVRIDATEIPFVFRQVQTADLADWNGNTGHAALAQLRDSIAGLIAGRAGSELREVKPRPPRPRSLFSVLTARPVYLILIPSGLVTLGMAAWLVFVLMGALSQQREAAALSGSTGSAPAHEAVSPTATPVPVAPTRTRVLPPPEATVVF